MRSLYSIRLISTNISSYKTFISLISVLHKTDSPIGASCTDFKQQLLAHLLTIVLHQTPLRGMLVLIAIFATE
jgi:hypothetical protein